MVKENFKIGVELEVNQSSLDKVSRQIQKQITDAIKQGTASTGKSLGAGSPATVRSVRETIKVDASDFAKEIQKAIATSTTAFTKASQEVVRAMNKFAAATGKPGGAAPARRGTAGTEAALGALAGRVKAVYKQQEEQGITAERTKEINRLLEKTARIMTQEQRLKSQNLASIAEEAKASRNLAAAKNEAAAAHREEARQTRQAARASGAIVLGQKKAGITSRRLVSEDQQGATNIGIGANIDVRRAAGSQRTAGSGAGVKAALLGDAPKQKTSAERRREAPERTSRYQAGANETINQVAKSLMELKNAIAKASGGKSDEKFFERIGLAGVLKMGAGASATIQRPGREAEHIGKTITIIDNKLKDFSNVVTDRIRQLTSSSGQERMGRMTRTAARDKGAFEAQARTLVSEVFGGLVPVSSRQPLSALQKGGEANLTIKVTGELQRRLSALENEAEVVSELNKILFQAANGVGELADEFATLKKAGVEVMTTFGLAESVAAKASVLRGEPQDRGRLGPVESVNLPVQTRNLAALGLGGAGAMRAARIFQPHQVANIEGGGVPSVMGRGEREMYQQGLYKPGAFKEAKLALVDPNKIPELFEDQILFDPKLFSAPMKEVRSQLVHQISEGIVAGVSLGQGQKLGTMIGGEDITFDKKGIQAKVVGVEKAIIEGVDAYRIEIEEVNDTITGMKLTERSGIKGIAKAVPNLAEKYGLPGGTAVAMGLPSVARRGSLRLPVEMMSNNIADATGKGAQEIADKIIEAMTTGGQEFAAAVKAVAEQYGLKGFTGAETVTTGPLAAAAGGRASIMTGRAAFGRLPNMGQEVGADIGERYLGAPDIQGLKLMASTAKMAQAMQENLAQLNEEFSELRQGLLSLAGDSDEAQKAVKGLAVVMPEAFKRLPQNAAAPADLKGTLLDPDLASAMALQLPGRGGNELLRVPRAGIVPGERESFQTQIGTLGAGKVTRQFDRIMEQATKVKAMRGELPLTESAEAMEEASYRANNAINEQIAAIRKLGVSTEEGAAAATKFIASMMPLVKMLGSGPAGLQYRKGEQIETIQASPEKYVSTRKNIEQQMFAIRDVLGKRPGGDVNIERLGAVFTNLEVLNKVMDAFNVRLDGTGESAEEAMVRLEKLKEGLVDLLAAAGMSRSKPGSAAQRSAAQAMEAGASRASYGTALEFPTDVAGEMAAVSARLREMKDAGHNVDEALSAFERMSALQKPQGGIPRDVLLINKSDWDNLIRDTSKKYNIPSAEAEERLRRPGLMHRYPVTGPASFLPATLRPVGSEMVPPGNFGVAGPAAISSAKDLENMLTPLRALKAANLEKLEALGGVGPEAERLAADIKALNQMIVGVTPAFRSIGLNLDFDGDHILFHGDVAKRAASNLETFSSRVAQAVNIQDAFINTMGKSVGKEGGGGIEEFSQLFGQIVKGRPAGLKRAVIRPEDEEMVGFEAQAHIAGKKSVALLSDMFNRMLLSVTAGGQKVGSAFEGWMRTIMLGINESLAQKHGGGGTTGPGQFLSALRKGQFGSIKEGMSGGEGFLGGLGNLNKQIKSQLREQLLVAGAGPGGMGNLQKFFDAEGIGAKMASEMKSGNLTSIVNKAVEELDLYHMLVRMFEMMKENMITATVKGGATLEEAVQSVNEALHPQGKTGFIKGIDQKKILETMAPGYAMTRQKAAGELAGMPGLEKARRLLELLPQQIAEQATEGLGSEFMEANTEEPAQRLREHLMSWLQTVEQQGVKYLSAAEMTKRMGAPIAGMYSPKEDQISIQKESREAPFRQALTALDMMGKGLLSAADMGTEGLRQLKKDLENFIGTLGHESVHQAANRFQKDVIAPLIASMNAPKGKGMLSMGAQGPNAPWLKEFVQKTPNLRRIQGIYEGMQGAQKAGQGTFSYTGNKGNTVVEKVTQQRIDEVLGILQNTIAQELLAYQFNPEAMGLKGISQIPESIEKMLLRRMDVLAQKAPETVGAARLARQAVDQIVSLMESTAQAGPAAARGMAQGRASQLLDFAGRGKFVSGQETLTAQEQAIMFSRQEHGLTSAMRKPTGELGLGELRKVAGAQHPKLEGVVQEIKEIQEAIVAGVAPEELNSLHKKIRGLAGKTAAILGRLTKSGELSGASPMKEMAAIVQDFFMTVAQRKTVEARETQRAIEQMRSEGKADLPEFVALLEQFDRKIADVNNWLEKATMERMGRHGSLAVGGTTRLGGELLAPFKGLGLDVARTENFRSAVGQQMGPGDEGTKFAERYSDALVSAAVAIRNGSTATQEWAKIFAILKQHPEDMKVDANKLQAIFTDMQRLLGSSDAKFASSATNMEEMAKSAAKVRDALKGISPGTTGEVAAAVFAGGTKQQKKAFAMGKDPGEQISDAMAAAESRRMLLEKMVRGPQYKAMGSPKSFEPQQFAILDPKTGETVQKITAQFKVMGNTVTSSMKQSGAATQEFGNQMQNAFRRVVQWGFASGIVYGTLRAFRALISTVIEVQNKIAELKKVMDTSVTSFDKMQDTAVSMAKEFGIAIGDVLDGMVVYGQQGLKMSEITERTRATMMAMNVTTLSATEATDALTAVMKVFSDDVGTSEQAVDAWAAVAAKHAISAEDLAIAVERTGAAAKTAGIDFNDLLGITTAIGSVTRQSGKEVATGVKFMARSMRAPAAQKQLLGVGIQGQSLSGELRPASDILSELAGKWGGLTRAQQLNIAQAMAGTRHYNQFLVLMNNWQEAVDASEDAQNSQGFATRKNAIAMQTFAKQVEVLKQTMNGLALDIGKAMLPAATGLVKVFQTLVNVMSYLPDTALQIGVAGAAGLLAFHKAADLALDSIMALGGSEIGGRAKKAGILGMLAGGGRAAGGAFTGLGDALKTSGKDAAARAPIAAFASYAGLTTDAGMLAKGLTNVKIAAFNAAEGFKAMSLASKILMTSGIGALLAIVGGLIVHFATMRKSGKDVEDSLYDLIGRSQDATAALQSQGTSLRKVSKSWTDYNSAVKVASDPAKLKESLLGGDYKSPLKALKTYRDTLASTGLAMAKLDPRSVEGISETGDYLIDVSGGYAMVAASAADAQKATTAALQTKVIKAYADEIVKAQGFWDTLIERITFGAADMSLAKDAADLREQIAGVAKEMDRLAEAGVASDFLQGRMNDLVREELEVREKMIGAATNLKRVLDEMPTFGSAEMAKMALGPELRKSIEAALPTGVFGKEATTGSVVMSKFARTAGLGGILGSEATSSPNRLLQELLEKGMRGRMSGQLGATQGGGLTVLDPKAAKALLEMSVGSEKIASMGPKAAQAIEGARTMITTVDEVTGQVVYHFEDGITGMIRTLEESAVNQVLTETATKAVTINRAEVEAAAERTKKLLTLQYTGALAGIRIPAGGMPQIGPGTRRELTTEQRVLGDLPEEMQRLADIQMEMSEIQKRYNEDLSDGADITEQASHTIKDNFRVLEQATKEMVMSFQMEGFDLTVLAHYDSALHRLNQSMEEAAKAARDAAIEEQTRAEFITHTAGALKGLTVAPQLDFGKSLRELGGQERLQKELGPGFSKTLTRIAGVESRRDVGVQRITDIRKQMADFDEMVSDLGTARTDLEREQSEARAGAALKGISEGDYEIAKKVQDSGAETTAAVQEQTPILDAMLKRMEILSEAAGMSGADKQKFVRQKIGEAKAEDLKKIIGAAGDKPLADFFSSKLGLRAIGEGERTFGEFAKGSRYRAETPAFAVQGESQGAFQQGIEKVMALKSSLATLSDVRAAGGPVLASEYNALVAQLDAAEKDLLNIPDVELAARNYASALAQTSKSDALRTKAEESAGKHSSLLSQIAQMRAKVLSNLTAAEGKAIAETEQATKILQSKEAFRLAVATQDFANALEGTIQEFKKAEMLFYEKTDSDLEGAFARVGQPGFKTTFEQQREEIEGRRMGGPRNLDAMRTEAADLTKLEYDEKEARIKETQDKEVSALREQQAQAEKLRDILAEQLLGGNLTPDAANMSKQYLQSLTDQLATSEQASMSGGELFFQGIPALDEARGFLQKIQEEAKAQAQKAEKQFQQEINKPMTDELVKQTGLLTSINDTLKAGEQKVGVAGPEGSMAGTGMKQALAGMAPIPPGAMSTAGSGDIMNWINALGNKPFEMRGDLGGGLGTRPSLGTSLGRHGGVDIYGGQADTKGMFVREQTIRSRMGDTGPLSEMEKMRSLMGIEKSSAATMSFSPTGAFKNASAFTNRPDEAFGSQAARQVGLSNYNQVMEAQNALKFGNRDVTSGAVLTDSKTGIASGAQNADRLATGQESPAATDQAESLATLSEQFETLIEAVNNLATTPDQGSTEIVSAITESSSTLAELLAGTLSVNVENTGLSVVVDGLDTALSAAFSSSGLGTVGAEVADTRLRLEVLEGIVDPDGPSVEDRITAVIEPLQATLDTTGTDLGALETTVSDLTSQVDALAALEGLDLIVETSLAEFSTTIEDLTTRVETAEDTVAAAAETVTDLQESMLALTTTVDANRRLSEAADRDLTTSLSRLETSVSQNTADIQTSRGKLETALSQAQQALNISRQAR